MSPGHTDWTGMGALPKKHMEAQRCVPRWAHRSHRCVCPQLRHMDHTGVPMCSSCLCLQPLIHAVVPLELRGTRETPKAEGARGQEGLPKSCVLVPHMAAQEPWLCSLFPHRVKNKDVQTQLAQRGRGQPRSVPSVSPIVIPAKNDIISPGLQLY